MIIGDDINLSLLVGDDPIPLELTDFSITIHESAINRIPTADISLVDNAALQNLPSLVDGTLLRVVYSNTATDEKWQIPLRVFTYANRREGDDTDRVEISCYYDSFDLFMQSKFKHYSGNSSTIAETLAREAGLLFDGDATDDNQIWIRQGVSGRAFLANLARHAYKDTLSVYATAVTRQGVLKYCDLTSRKKLDPLWVFTTDAVLDPKSNKITVHPSSIQYTSRSGLFNLWRAYGLYANYHDAVKGKRIPIAITSFDKSTDRLAMSIEATHPSKSLLGPMDCGNTHPNYFKALIQNEQNLSLYCNIADFVSSSLRDVSLFDRVVLTLPEDRDNTLRQPITGAYFISKITTRLTKEGALIRYNAVREGFNSTDDKTIQGVH